MTNKEWMATLTAKQCYDVMSWLFNDFAARFEFFTLAIIEWLDAEHMSAEKSWPYSPPHNK